MEFQLASMDASVEVTRSGLDEKSDHLRDVQARDHLTTATAITPTPIIIATCAAPPTPRPSHPHPILAPLHHRLHRSRAATWHPTPPAATWQVKLEQQERAGTELSAQTMTVLAMERDVKEVVSRSSAWGLPFWILFLLLVALAGVGYNRYRKIMKSHLL